LRKTRGFLNDFWCHSFFLWFFSPVLVEFLCNSTQP
jgi:hypothetical protein